ncbi:MAG: glycosyltransferase family 2 protein [Cyanobacteriota bacterium]
MSGGHPGADPALAVIMPTISWEGSFEPCARRVLELLRPGDQFVVVLDGASTPAPAWLQRAGVDLLATGHWAGPEVTRNLGAHTASAPVLLFVDADVELHHDSLERMRAHFRPPGAWTAVFGSYDDRPVARGLVSEFRNLLHHHTHTSHPGPAGTFWTGCGAVRRDRFLALGGFDPNCEGGCEDIELGIRLTQAGDRILLDPTILGTHHKRWTLRSMVLTDIRLRALPWSRLLKKNRQLPVTLNLSIASRLSGLASVLLPFSLLASPWCPAPWGPALLMLAAALVLCLLLLNRRFYGFLLRHRGPAFLLGSLPLHWLYLFYSTLCFAAVRLGVVR